MRDGTKPRKELRIPSSFIGDDWSGSGNSAQPSRMFRLKIVEPTRLFLGIHQEDPRLLGVSPPLKVGLWIVDKQNQTVAMKQSYEAVCQVETILQPGHYRIMAKALSRGKGVHVVTKLPLPESARSVLSRRFVLTLHSDKQVVASLMAGPRSSTDVWKEFHAPSSFVADDWSTAVQTVKQPTRIFRLRVMEEKTRVHLGIDQEDPEHLQGVQPFKIGVWIMDKDNRLLAVKQSDESLCQVEVTLSQGLYRLMVKALGYTDHRGFCSFPDSSSKVLPHPFMLSVMSDKQVDVFVMTNSSTAKLLSSTY
ncbi:hypothetical protein CBR_g37131 [Chara braunii]|uniref:Uncharacterized protein n=1 Tax=Chara braunii TaxID=69332 RepID=A0A388LM81_CHABU|nr:hypothetical protein CBR_g37131 [Chara braunii]|eukprot:GBG83417.1 hypothetical protein CBR_g37131 [Chara braunii]